MRTTWCQKNQFKSNQFNKKNNLNQIKSNLQKQVIKTSAKNSSRHQIGMNKQIKLPSTRPRNTPQQSNWIQKKNQTTKHSTTQHNKQSNWNETKTFKHTPTFVLHLPTGLSESAPIPVGSDLGEP